MERKVIQLSTSTKVVSLPASWLKKNMIKKGEKIELEELDNKLIISQVKRQRKETVEIDAFAFDEDLLWMAFDAAYMLGYSDIMIKTRDHEQTMMISKIVKYFPGTIIFSEREGLVHVKDIVSKEDIDLQGILSRIRNMTLALLDDSIDAANKGKWEVLLDAKKRDYSINSYVSLAFRHINSVGYVSMRRHSAMCQYIRILEMIADRICMLLSSIAMQKKASANVVNAIKEFRELYRKEAFLTMKFSPEKIAKYDEERLNFEKDVQRIVIYTAQFLELSKLLFEIEELSMQLNL